MNRLWPKLGNSGASAAEYALMIGLIGGVVVISATALGRSMRDVLTSFASHITLIQ